MSRNKKGMSERKSLALRIAWAASTVVAIGLIAGRVAETVGFSFLEGGAVGVVMSIGVILGMKLAKRLKRNNN